MRGDWDPIIIGHLWSLAVEEQFYLIWPVVLLLAWRWWRSPLPVGLLATAMILMAAVWHQMLTEAQHAQEPGYGVLLPHHLDALGSGALLAWAEATGRLRRWWGIAAAAVVVTVVTYTIGLAAVLPLRGVAGPLSCLLYVTLILFARRGPSAIAGILLGNPALVWLGRRSYGVYLYHIYIAYAVGTLIDIRLTEPGWPTLLVCGGASIGAAALSWRYLEQPLLRLKMRWTYVAPQGGTRTLQPA